MSKCPNPPPAELSLKLVQLACRSTAHRLKARVTRAEGCRELTSFLGRQAVCWQCLSWCRESECVKDSGVRSGQSAAFDDRCVASNCAQCSHSAHLIEILLVHLIVVEFLRLHTRVPLLDIAEAGHQPFCVQPLHPSSQPPHRSPVVIALPFLLFPELSSL